MEPRQKAALANEEPQREGRTSQAGIGFSRQLERAYEESLLINRQACFQILLIAQVFKLAMYFTHKTMFDSSSPSR
jgi:hypothetical protein